MSAIYQFYNMKVGMLIQPSTTVKEFCATHMPLIQNYLGPHTTFMLTDEHVTLLRYFHTIGFRNCIVYHVGDQPRYNMSNYKTVKVSSYVEARATIIKNSNRVLH